MRRRWLKSEVAAHSSTTMKVTNNCNQDGNNDNKGNNGESNDGGGNTYDLIDCSGI
ncbi:hypothetical protein TSUD_91480 [Trifolium subterraneum]|uniref:Uncharacterized protein n=1 Tax=Trifolium subterraneum TaxID=3900 RepID=A0A2Z6NQU1_TRISU|nr:hypothetical protein TSUD_91480 [Trifolium subterraneum]